MPSPGFALTSGGLLEEFIGRLVPVTDHPPPRPPLDRERLGSIPAGGITWAVEVLDEAPSTNALVLERARDGAPEGLVLVAEHQTAGRGRLDRTWVTPARSALTFSLLLRPGAEPLTAETLREFCAGKLAHYKVPRYVKIVEEFPMTVTGKIRKVEMRTVSVEELGLQGAAAVKNA